MRARRNLMVNQPATGMVTAHPHGASAKFERSGVIDQLEKIITQDIGGRGLAVDPHDNLVTRCRGNLLRAARHLASDGTAVAIVTGLYVAHAAKPAIETDGPCGAIALAWLLAQMGSTVTLITDPLGVASIEAGVRAASIGPAPVAIEVFPFDDGRTEVNSHDHDTSAATQSDSSQAMFYAERFFRSGSGTSLTHLLAIERAGPSWSPLPSWPASDVARFKELCPEDHQEQVHNFRGQIITHHTAKTHLLFDFVKQNNLPVRTIGIGDGGNEIGMGAVPWQVIHTNIPNGLGARIACRVATDWTIACGVSNWGAYALGAAVAHLIGQPDLLLDWSDQRERDVLTAMVNAGAVDGVTGKPSLSVDGLALEQHLEIWRQIRDALRSDRRLEQ
jgi:hypothetical protein